MHRQKGERVDSFITSLRLTEHCNYRNLHYEMIEIGLLWAYEIQIYRRHYKLIQN